MCVCVCVCVCVCYNHPVHIFVHYVWLLTSPSLHASIMPILVVERLKAHLYVANSHLTADVVTSYSNITIIPSRKKFRY